MEVARQVRLLLWRNALLRIRQPVILALELLWPVAIFLVVMTARKAIPPVAQPTCHYKAWALPSAGLLPFVQSMVCNIDVCQNYTDEIPHYEGSSVIDLVSSTLPLLSNENITELVEALPNGMRLMRTAVDALNKPHLAALLDNGLPIKDLLKDANKTSQLLLTLNLTDQDVSQLINSSIQLPQILELISPGSLCEAESEGNAFGRLRFRLCSITDHKRKDFFREIKSHLDLKSLVQTVGIALSSLGRTDVAEALRNVGGLLLNLQSSSLLREDFVPVFFSLLESVQLQNIDTSIIPLVIDDLEPLYKNSQWSSLIQVLKGIKLPSLNKDTTSNKLNRIKPASITDGEISGQNSEKIEVATLSDPSNATSISGGYFQILLNLTGTSIDALKFFPQQVSLPAQSWLKRFIQSLDVFEVILAQMEKSLRKDNSTDFMLTFRDVLGATFLNIAHSNNLTSSEAELCNPKEFQKSFSPLEWYDIKSLQNLACRIARLNANENDASEALDVSQLHESFQNLQKIFQKEMISQMQSNVAKWSKENDSSFGKDPSPPNEKSPFTKATKIEDVINILDCAIVSLQNVESHDSPQYQNESTSGLLKVSDELGKHSDKLLIMGLIRTMELGDFIKRSFLQLNQTQTVLSSFLAGVNKFISSFIVSGNSSDPISDLLHNLPSPESTKNVSKIKDQLIILMNKFLQDLEIRVWDSITPKMVETFTKSQKSRSFCIDERALEAKNLHWKNMLCHENDTSLKLQLQKKDFVSNSDLLSLPSNASLDLQTFSQMLVQATSTSGIAIRSASLFLDTPLKDCSSSCGKPGDVGIFRKMCFLARLHNARSAFSNDEKDDDILQPFLPLNENIVEGYKAFIEALRLSSMNNSTDWKDIVQLIISGFRFVEAMGGQKIRPVFHVTSSLISLLKNRASDAALTRTSPMVQIENVFPDAPFTQELVKSLLPVLPELTSTFFWTALVPGKMWNLVSDSERNVSLIISRVCNTTLTHYLYNPSLSSHDFNALKNALCSHPYYDVFEEVFQDPDIQEIVFEASSTDDVSWEDMQDNLLEISSLLTDLSKLRKADASSFPPLLKWQNMTKSIHTQLTNPSVMFYVLSNSLFHRFCNDQHDLYQALCALGSERFTSNLIHQANRTILTLKANNISDVATVSKEMWSALRAMPEIRHITKWMTGVDALVDNSLLSSDASTLTNRSINTMTMVFDIVDGMTEGKLSKSFFVTFVPDIFQEVALTLRSTDSSLYLGNLLKEGLMQDQTSFDQKNFERKKFESYLNVVLKYFSKEENSLKLRILCSDAKQTLEKSDFSKLACSQPPSDWLLTMKNSKNFTETQREMENFLKEDITNTTRDLYLRQRKSIFFHSLNEIVKTGYETANKTNNQGSSFYFSSLKSIIEILGNNSISSAPCLTNSTLESIRISASKLAKSISDLEFLACTLPERNISSFYSWFSESVHLKSVFEKAANALENGENCSHSWSWMIDLLDQSETLTKRLFANVTETQSKQIEVCLRNLKQSPFLSNLQEYLSVMQQAVQVMSRLNASPILVWGDVKQRISDEISQHLPVFLPVSSLVIGSLSSNSQSDVSTEIDFQKDLMDSTINSNWMLREGLTASSMRHKLCGPILTTSILRTSPNVPPEVPRDLLCMKDGIERLLERVNRTALEIKMRESQEKLFYSAGWLEELVASSDVLINIATRLGSFLGQHDFFRLLSEPQTVENITQNVQELVDVLESVFPGSSLIDNLREVKDGLRAFNSLSQLANLNFTYKVKDVFGDDVFNVLRYELRMDPQFVSTFVNSEVDLKKAILEKGEVHWCDGKPDSLLLCTLSTHQNTSVTQDRLNDLIFQKFLFSLGTLGVEGVLHSARVDEISANRALAVLSRAPEIVQELSDNLHRTSVLMRPEVGELFKKLEGGLHWIASSEALSIGGKILCGKPLESLSRKFLLLAPDEPENKIEEKELRRLPTDFCRHGYREIMKMRSGAILWGFLKPLFRGKILYAPKTYKPGIAIISKVNESFSLLEKQMRFIKAAAEGASGLSYLQRNNNTLQSLERFFSSASVRRFLGSPSWLSALTWLEEPGSSVDSLRQLVELVGNVSECISLDRFIGFDTEEELEAAAATLHDRREFIAAIVFFENYGINNQDLPQEVHYKIRMDIDNVPTTDSVKYRWWRPYSYDDFFEDLRYFRGFLQLQDTLDEAIIQLQRPDSFTTRKYLQQFPYPCHQRDKFGALLKGSMPAVMTISWVFIVAFLVRERVLERELQLDEPMRAMGLRSASGWLSWLVSGLCVLLVSVCGIVVVLKWGGITPHSDASLLFLFVALFALLLLAYCQLMSTFFDRASTAALLSVLLYVLSFFPFLLFVTWELDFLYWQKLLSCVLVSTSFCFGCLYLNRYEDQGEGVQWKNVWQSPVAGDRMNFGTTLVAMTVCAAFYFVLAAYAAKIQSGFKSKKPLAWYFFMKSPPSPDTSDCKLDLKKSSVGVFVRGVRAVYAKSGEWRALSALNLNLHEGNITALLGHNGAGKTTTLKILTGRLKPVSGKVYLYGIPVSENPVEARKIIGFCPQSNTLYDKLTVKEHLGLFARLKGILDEDLIASDVDSMLSRLQLRSKGDEWAETLSGGQRRRLCVALAFVGGSRVVILDEPTSSVDPVARRSIWDLILAYKKGRTILFTTHHLDEADILSDQVAILHKGRLLCCGSPLDLKVRFGSGYRLSLLSSIEKTESDSGRASSIHGENTNVECDALMEVVQGFVPDATLLENDDSHLVVSLPAESISNRPLSPFFGYLEKSLPRWGFHSYSLSSATLEEVFLTLCRLEDAKNAHSSEKTVIVSPFRACKPELTNPSNYKKELEIELKPPSVTTSRVSLRYLQLRSLLTKRYYHTRRNWKALLSSIALPCVFIALAMGLAVGRPQKSPDPAIELSPSLYTPAVSIFSWPDSESKLGSSILKTIGNSSRTISQSSAIMSSKKCLCETECSEVPATPDSILSVSNHLLFNLTTVDISSYLLNTYLQFNERRYGGWTVRKSPNSSEEVAKVWFENSGYHAAPSYLNVLNNAILQKNAETDLRIRTWNHPLRLSVEQLGRETLLQRLGEVGISFVFLIGLSLVPCTFAMYLVNELASEQRRLLGLSVPPWLYWFAALIWDLTIVLVTTLLSSVIVASFALPPFYHRDNFKAVTALIFLYGWSTTPLTYLCCGLFGEGSLAFMVLFTTHLFIGLVIMLALVSLRIISLSRDMAWALWWVERFSLIFPQYSLVGGLTQLNENQIRSEIFAQFGQDVYVSPFAWSALAPNLLTLAVQGIIFFVVKLIVDTLPRLHSRYQKLKSTVEGGRTQKLLDIQSVSQIYSTKAGPRYAVNNFSLNIPQGECLGLVGANGAGKTTLFRLLIGQIRPTSGKIVTTDNDENLLGYCPQKDALDGLLTPRQHLEVYAGIQGIPASHIRQVVSEYVASLDLGVHVDRPVSTLSGGTKRKLCTAIAMLGDPRLILLDEPTSGMDPATRRLVWRRISKVTQSGRSVLLTSHSIEDCDVLCSRIGIMVNGKLACLDSPAKLKSKLGTGYTVSFKVSKEQIDWGAFLKFVQTEIPTARIQIHNERRVELCIPGERVSLHALFTQLEKCGHEFGIHDLAIDPTTLDQVFVNFVKQQSDAALQEQEPKTPHPISVEQIEICCTKL